MNKSSKSFGSRQLMTTIVTTSIFFPALILFLAGNWRWIEGWIFALWIAAMILANVLYMYFNDPALLAERSKTTGGDNQKAWDKVLLVVIYCLAIGWLVLMPLDAERFHWSPAFPIWVKVIGGLALLPAFYLLVRPTIENTYLSTRVRIQTERKQKVISSGVYGFVRHPLYLGCVLMISGAPLLLGSVVGLVIGMIGVAVLVFRIVGEEKMLENELEGYREYEEKVRYRLIPGVW